jgi:hypothetical protein
MDYQNSTVIGRLVAEISWQGNKVKQYRNGGRGIENILTAETILALDLLPRSWFLGEIFKDLNGKAQEVKEKLVAEAETLDITFLSDHIYLDRNASHEKGFAVDPDVVLTSDEIYAFIEVKRIRENKFQSEQLAREYLVLTRDALDRMPAFLLFLGRKPPIKVDKLGYVEPKEAILKTLDDVYGKLDKHPASLDELKQNIDATLLWISWQEIANIIERQISDFECNDQSVYLSIQRICKLLQRAIVWHS